KLAAEMRQLQEIFAEVIDRNARVADRGRILDPRGTVLRDYSDRGLPAYLEFEAPIGTDYFILEVNGQRVQQPLRDGVRIQEKKAEDIPVLSPAPAAAPPMLAAPVIPIAPPAPAPSPAPAAAEEEEGSSEWKDIPLEFESSFG